MTILLAAAAGVLIYVAALWLGHKFGILGMMGIVMLASIALVFI